MTSAETNTGPTSELSEFIVAEVHRQTSEDKLRALVDKKIGEAIDGAIDTAFRSYGNIYKQIEQVVQQALDIREYQLDVPAYGNMVMALLRGKLDETLSESINKRLSEEMAEILTIAPKELKLSKVVDAMVGDQDQSDRYGTSVTCIVEAAFPDSDILEGYQRIYLDEADNEQPRQCDVSLVVNREGVITDLAVNGQDVKTAIRMGGTWGWKKSIFAAYCSGSKFIVDEDMISPGIGDY
jgi:hypothetical protein